MNEEEIILSFIVNEKSGIIYADEIFQVQIKGKSSIFSSDHNDDLYLNEVFFCNFYIANPMRNLLSFSRQKNLLELSNGKIISFHTSPSKFSLKELKVIYELKENGELIAQVNATRHFKYNLDQTLVYKGDIIFKDNIPEIELIFFIHFILIDRLYLERRHY
ncbi:hypothetical protein [Fluviicola taffensis]|uniref:hypothetical protein n=1 Tax=Fluviicola taffensis TaxID=191579 RepID=UPI0031376FED